MIDEEASTGPESLNQKTNLQQLSKQEREMLVQNDALSTAVL